MPSDPGSKPRTREELQKELQDMLAARQQQQQHDTSGMSGGSSAGIGPGQDLRRVNSSSASDLLKLPAGAKDGIVGESSHSHGPQSWVADMSRVHQGGGDGSKAPRLWHVARVNFQGATRVLRLHPSTWITGLLVAVVLAGAGVAGVMAAARAETNHRFEAAQGFADNTAVGFEVQLQQMYAPMLALAAFIHDNPDYPHLAKRFDKIAQELLAAVPDNRAVVQSLQATPQGVVRSFYPLAGNEVALYHNLFKDPARRPAALETIARRELTLQGPLVLKQGFVGLVPRLPIFVENVTDPNERFGAPDDPYNCSICYDPVAKRMFWGFVSCIINFDAVKNGTDPRLVSLRHHGYEYSMTAPQPEGGPFEFARSANPPSPGPNSVTGTVHVPNSNWTLLVAPTQGWVPSWRDPMIATAVIASALIGLLVGAVLVSRKQQAWLLSQMKTTNAALAGEKERMDVLLARQYNLISCVLESGGVVGSDVGKERTVQEKTLARIEDMRRAIGVASNSGPDEMQFTELLGEGTFGKVYKGMWRGSTVAIKTMILPAKMSGAEKRERMAIMEAAISSSMNHPNIVQTYTYTIKPTTGSNMPPGIELAGSCLGSFAPGGSSGGVPTPPSPGTLISNPHVHSFEVSLVLEFCDWGCLRDALNAGAFYTADNSLNYAAILDTAADVAKAMLHLHRHQVIHSDLKVRNVLLKTDGSDGRGVVAKVADFGLAVKIDSMDTHVSAFQGTLSHMAPEAQLGRVSKAGDVYSFGITLWELYTGGHAFADVPRALLGHKVAVQGLRPVFPVFAPSDLKALAEACWAPDPDKRPTFERILDGLQRMRRKVGGTTPPLARYALKGFSLSDRDAPAVGGASSSPPVTDSIKMMPGVAPAPGASSVALPPSVVQLGSITSYYVGESTASGDDSTQGMGQWRQPPPGPPHQPDAQQFGAHRRGGMVPGSFMSRLEPIADTGEHDAAHCQPGQAAAAAGDGGTGGAGAQGGAGDTAAAAATGRTTAGAGATVEGDRSAGGARPPGPPDIETGGG